MIAADTRLSIAYSPCPNDTFIFHALVHGEVGGPAMAAPVLADVETLNGWAMAARFDISKLSFAAYGHVRDRYRLLSAGAALGRGCGPLLVCRRGERFDPARASIAIPGRLTTAAMLLRLFAPTVRNLTEMRFDRIIPAILAGRVDAGVIIHESRFTYRQEPLSLVRDLGAWWEEETGHPIPLGGIVARRTLGEETIAAIDGAIRASVLRARARPEECLPYIRRHAQEMDAEVIRQHIALYVNDFSVDLGAAGLAAVDHFLRLGDAAGLFAHG
ncbi:MAG: 1,4-dihydroxy-6-naphthoate synthase [Thermodesulfobacteriota bacterium]